MVVALLMEAVQVIAGSSLQCYLVPSENPGKSLQACESSCSIEMLFFGRVMGQSLDISIFLLLIFGLHYLL